MKLRNKKTLIPLIITVAIVATLFPYTALALDQTNPTTIIEYSSNINEEYTDEINSSVSGKRNAKGEVGHTDLSLIIRPSTTKNVYSGLMKLSSQNGSVTADVTGYLESYSGTFGNVGVFDGIALIDGSYTQVTLDILYIDENENFTALTVGTAGDIAPDISFFGEFTQDISLLSSKNVENTLQASTSDTHSQLGLPDIVELNSVDATTRFQSTNTKSASGYETATISLYHANELRNQGSMSVYAKVNSHSASFKEYLKNVHGFDGTLSSLIVYPDSYMVEIVGADKYLHSNGVVIPIANTTSQTLTFPAYLPYIGFFTFGIPLTMNSTTISYRGVAVSPLYNDNIITWNVFKRYGWNPPQIDGYYDDAEGGIVRAGYTYESSITSNVTTAMGAYGQVRYEYVYTPFLASSITLHMWTDKAACANSLTILP